MKWIIGLLVVTLLAAGCAPAQPAEMTPAVEKTPPAELSPLDPTQPPAAPTTTAAAPTPVAADQQAQKPEFQFIAFISPL